MKKENQKVFAVFGLGAFGQTVAEVLAEKGGDVIVVDNDPALIESLKNKVTTALLLDSTDEKALAKAPIDDVDVAIVAMGDDLEVNIITTALLKQRGIPYIVCRSTSGIHGQVLRQIGANEVINLQKNVGKNLAQRLIASEVLDTIQISEEYSFSEMYVPEDFIGEPCEKLQLEEKFSLHLCAVKRIKTELDNGGNPLQKETILLNPEKEILEDSDILLIIGRNPDIEEFKKVL